MKNELNEALTLLENEKGIKREYVLEALENALTHAYKKNYKEDRENVEVRINSLTGEIKVISKCIVVENIGDFAETNEILVEDAKRINKDARVGDCVEKEILPRDFGRIAAQTAKQIILQKIREAEREQVLKDFDIKVGDIISGFVDRVEKVEFKNKDGSKKDDKLRFNVIFDLGKADAVMPAKGQVSREKYTHGKRMLLYVMDINNTPRGPYVQVSRSGTEFVAKLFEREVPEIKDGIVEIKSVSREPGVRSKIAVISNDSDVEPVGSCVGNKGGRVNAVVAEMGGEKVDIIKYSENPEEFIGAALAPAKATKVVVNYAALEQGNKEAMVVVEEGQLSLAIGKEGLNAKLAARLTGWKIDIKSDKQYNEEISEPVQEEDI